MLLSQNTGFKMDMKLPMMSQRKMKEIKMILMVMTTRLIIQSSTS